MEGSNVHPEESKRWVLRVGGEIRIPDDDGVWQPYLALDAQWEKDVGWDPRVAVQAGLWLPRVNGRQRFRAALELITGPSPLGQFQGRPITQLGLSLILSP